MQRPIVILVLVACVAAGSGPAPVALAQGNAPGTVTVSSAVTGTHLYTGDLDAGGDLQWSGVAFSGGVARQFVPAFSAGLSLRYGYEEWRFRSATAFEGETPWRRLERPGVSLNMNLALSRTLLVGVSPTIEWACDSRADLADACVYGAVLSAVHVVSPKLLLGAGASVTRQFYSLKTSPFVIVNWRITERLRLANAVPAGPLGGAGVELRCALTPDWEVAAGGVQRSDRWRLAGDGPLAASVGETSSFPLLGRLSHTFRSRARIDLYTGVVTGTRITLRDSDGKDLGHDGYGVAPVVAATLSGRF